MANTRKKSNKRIYWIIGVFVILIGALIGLKEAGVIGKENAISVQTAPSEIRTVYSRVTESGTIQPTIDVPVAPDVSGEVVFIGIKEGMRVKKGDLLVTILPDDYKALLEQAQASLAQAKAGELQAKAALSQAKATLLQDSVNWERTKKLYNDKVVSQVEFENAELQFNVSKSQYNSAQYNVRAAYYQVKNSEASVKQARQNLNRTNIYASMDGTITQLNVELGQRVVGTRQMAGTDILKVADLSSMEVVVEVNENDIINVSLGDSAKIEVDAFPDRDFFGKVTEIAYSANVAGLGSTDQVTNFEVTVEISPSSYEKLMVAGGDIPRTEESPFRPGMTSLVEIYTQKVNDAVVVPISAVTLSREAPKDTTQTQASTNEEEERQEVVFVLENDAVKEVPVEIGISDDNFIVIKDGIDAGVEVVTGPYTTLTKRLEDGMKVKKTESRGRGNGQVAAGG